MSSMLLDLPDLPDVDWTNPDVQRVLEMFGWRYEQKCKEVTERDRQIAEQDRRIAELEAQVKALQDGGAETTKLDYGADEEQQNRRKLRKYNTREFKDYPRVEGTPRTQEYSTYKDGSDFSALVFKTVQKTADIRNCSVHGTRLSKNVTEMYERIATSISPCTSNIGRFVPRKHTQIIFLFLYRYKNYEYEYIICKNSSTWAPKRQKFK